MYRKKLIIIFKKISLVLFSNPYLTLNSPHALHKLYSHFGHNHKTVKEKQNNKNKNTVAIRDRSIKKTLQNSRLSTGSEDRIQHLCKWFEASSNSNIIHAMLCCCTAIYISCGKQKEKFFLCVWTKKSKCNPIKYMITFKANR